MMCSISAKRSVHFDHSTFWYNLILVLLTLPLIHCAQNGYNRHYSNNYEETISRRRVEFNAQRETPDSRYGSSREPKVVEGSYFDQYRQRVTPIPSEHIRSREHSRTEYDRRTYPRVYSYDNTRDRNGENARTYDRSVPITNYTSRSSSSQITRYHNTSISQGSRTVSITGTGRQIESPILWYNRTWHWSTNRTRTYDPDLDGTTLTPDFDRFSENIIHKYFDNTHPFNIYGPTSCDEFSCHPPTGDLLIGRENKLFASSTCGIEKSQRYCILPHLQTRKKCYICDSSEKNVDDNYKYHKIHKIVSKANEHKNFWWQAENGVENVTIKLDLEAEFQFTHLIIVFQTFRPAAMIIERSDDGGKTWKVYQYFAYNCKETFPHVPLGPRQKISDVVCESKYSDVEPSQDGEVIFSVLPQHIKVENPYDEEVQNLIRITNLRINFTKLHTLGDNKLSRHIVDAREDVKRKYYYAIKNMKVRGSCSCYGHASRCISDGTLDTPGMVYGKCDCNHNTTGANCERCKDLYDDIGWHPAIGKETHACKKCNCNNHATKCRFDEAVYMASGNVSGGVCLDCQHNTEGKNCETCKSFYFKDPNRPIDDPYACQPCDCDPQGSLEHGACDHMDDPKSGMVAGKCHCKDYVEGRRCDRCKPGYWNLDKSNHLGCQPCSCNRLGTVGNKGCNVLNGECLCKRNVIGKDCNQCAPEHYGLGEEDEGCFPCECDLGGSLHNNCNEGDGQCACRPHITGRTCNKMQDSYFAPYPDFYTIEGESSRPGPKNQIIVRERYPGQEVSYTGDGFMEVFTESFVEVDVSQLVTSMDYGVVIRYEPKYNQQRLEAQIIIDRRGYPVDPYGPCKHNTKDRGTVTFNPNQRVAVVSGGPFCFEKGIDYKIKLEMLPSVDTSSVLIDSIVLIPNVDNTNVMKNANAKREFEHYQCAHFFNTVSHPGMPEVCKKYLYSISMEVMGAVKCDCDPMGSKSALCNEFGGTCECRPNVVGRRCDQCANGFHSFSPDGCKPCDCDSTGSFDNVCDKATGQCKCRNNTYGRKCDECQPGYWNYPACEKCRCNENADRCDTRTGICINCKHKTTGPHCETCEAGYYGNPLFGSEYPCKPCPCPGIPGSGISHADGCYLDPRTQSPICRCHVGYTGERCDKCANNYWGNPNVPGSECRPCECNNNIDISQPGNCDQRTGECLQCIFNTEGARCEICKDGFYGNATLQQCRQCVCNSLGTDSSKGTCDRITGQCPCFDNVEGLECDRCSVNHWNLSSKKGCEPCNCDPQGSYKQNCNEIDGTCQCLQGYGGKRCDECEPNYYGDPKIQCYRCECNTPGAATTWCHKNGSCICQKGIAGERCEKCARGYTGTVPHCSFCGECFENWDSIIQHLKNETSRLLESARRIKQTGTTGAYKEQFNTIESNLLEIEAIIAGANVTDKDISQIQSQIANLNETLVEIQVKLNLYDGQIKAMERQTTDADLALSDLRRRVDSLKIDTQSLKENATNLQATNVEGAYNLTKDAQTRSRLAQERVRDALPTMEQSASLRRQTERLLEQAAERYNKSYSDNQLAISDIQNRITSLENEIPNVNDLVCGGRSTVNECDALCGGALCGKCGGLACKGAVTIAGNAYEFGSKAEELLASLQSKVNEQWNNIYEAKLKADEALREAYNAHNKAKSARSESEDTTKEIEDLLNKIDAFLDKSNAQPSEIRTLAENCEELDISLTPDQILKLAKEINDTIASITNIDKILMDTTADLATANRLRNRADEAKSKADNILNTAKQVIDTLKQAAEAQQKAEEAINKATSHIETTQQDLKAISDETESTTKIAQQAIEGISDLETRLDELRRNYTQNELFVGKAVKEAELAGIMAKEAESGARELENKFEEVASFLDAKSNVSERVKERAESLRERARLLAENANSKLKILQDIEDEFDDNERRLKNYQQIIAELNANMTDHLAEIERLANYHRICNG